MNPPPELAWIGIIGGTVGILTAIVNLTIIWRNRRRLEFRIVSATVYAEPWRHWEVDKAGFIPGTTKKAIKEGDIKRAFIITEFAVKNDYPTETTIGRFRIENWMFSDRFRNTGISYPLKHDYRVFDLYTGSPINLEKYARIAPRSLHSLRLEVLEDTDGPEYGSNHSRYVVNIPKHYTVEFLSDTHKFRYKIKFKKVISGEYFSLDNIHHWSDLLPELHMHGYVDALPQGLEIPEHRPPLNEKVQDWITVTKNRFLYGTRYHWPEQVSRVSKLRGSLKKLAQKILPRKILRKIRNRA